MIMYQYRYYLSVWFCSNIRTWKCFTLTGIVSSNIRTYQHIVITRAKPDRYWKCWSSARNAWRNPCVARTTYTVLWCSVGNTNPHNDPLSYNFTSTSWTRVPTRLTAVILLFRLIQGQCTCRCVFSVHVQMLVFSARAGARFSTPVNAGFC